AAERHVQVQAFIARFEALWSAELARRRATLRPGLDPEVAAVTSIHAIRGAMLALARRDPPLPRDRLVHALADLGVAYLTG
ncbi:MAG: hypothetical protein OXR73_25045, partial [Myxococcales bacterium]|nr:hypothetical protein [Myxococcales bacterium]